MKFWNSSPNDTKNSSLLEVCTTLRFWSHLANYSRCVWSLWKVRSGWRKRTKGIQSCLLLALGLCDWVCYWYDTWRRIIYLARSRLDSHYSLWSLCMINLYHAIQRQFLNNAVLLVVNFFEIALPALTLWISLGRFLQLSSQRAKWRRRQVSLLLEIQNLLCQIWPKCWLVREHSFRDILATSYQ